MLCANALPAAALDLHLLLPSRLLLAHRWPAVPPPTETTVHAPDQQPVPGPAACRVGRTARAGAKGRALTFIEDGDRPLLKEVCAAQCHPC